jgi:hypothetical protein
MRQWVGESDPSLKPQAKEKGGDLFGLLFLAGRLLLRDRLLLFGG